MLKLPTVFCLITFSLLAAVHYVALQLFLYWRFWWFDIPMHFIGGTVVALGIFTLYDLSLPLPKRYLRLVPVLVLTLVVALIWEVFELGIGISIEDDYVFDTSLDLVMGVLGAAAGYYVGNNINKI